MTTLCNIKKGDELVEWLGKYIRRIQIPRTLKHTVMIAAQKTYFANSAFIIALLVEASIFQPKRQFVHGPLSYFAFIFYKCSRNISWG